MRTIPYTISEDDRLLIVSANSGGGGWKMARLSCCYDRVYWYADKNNGEHPWTLPDDYECTERILAKQHFNRILPNGDVVPLFGERVSRFWNDDEWMMRWQMLFYSLDLPDKKLVYVSHDSPKDIRTWFPNSTIINLYEEDSRNSSDWHLQTSANYRINHHFSGMKPAYQNRYQKMIDTILTSKKDPQTRDIWLYETFGTLQWTEELKSLYEEYEHHRIKCENHMRLQQADYCNLTTTWKTFNPDMLETFLGKLDDNHTKVYGLKRFV